MTSRYPYIAYERTKKSFALTSEVYAEAIAHHLDISFKNLSIMSFIDIRNKLTGYSISQDSRDFWTAYISQTYFNSCGFSLRLYVDYVMQALVYPKYGNSDTNLICCPKIANDVELKEFIAKDDMYEKFITYMAESLGIE